jgi:phosphoadenosine phosphosulfate reductase
MLIPSERHTPDDLRLWAEYEHADQVHGRAKQLAKKACAAVEAIGKFASKGRCYASVSWGKDSTALADLVLRASRVYGLSIPFAWVRVEPIRNPDCAAVRDAFLAANPGIEYHEVEQHCEWRDGEWHASGTLEAGFREAASLAKTGRYLSGVRADESTPRFLLSVSKGISTANTCRPLTWWTSGDVMAWLAHKSLPVHPVYAMTGGGRWPREQLRVASLSGRRGDGHGRAEWEREYYGDILRRLQAGSRLGLRAG